MYKSNIVLILNRDDIILFGRTQKDWNNIIQLLTEYIHVNLIGKNRKTLGVNFEEINGKNLIHQIDYIYIKKLSNCYRQYRILIT